MWLWDVTGSKFRRLSDLRVLPKRLLTDICLETQLSSLTPLHLLTSFFSVVEFLWLVMSCQPATLPFVCTSLKNIASVVKQFLLLCIYLVFVSTLQHADHQQQFVPLLNRVTCAFIYVCYKVLFTQQAETMIYSDHLNWLHFTVHLSCQ